ncbi:GDSL-like lipase/acylhydrolase family protein [Streptomyces sp. Ag109_O5-1]|uniref:SGNH/GDSL hydrolase family protein n=1 Tax=Streptomyces sp. Ag109_O5-1 TaxID=1938851 RepID=UPI000F502D21|nr:SGNH/GDSL hydrolase family protein [Streptomyces sp. Ag109_O5-1]RPE37789.1 GDSL-like lipase/acylhydrolase family protein [Streptomyces sp. Ag109_O5-1]
MRIRTGFGLAAVASCVTLAAVVTVGRDGGGGAASRVPPPKGPYVALGDSYTAGPEIPGRHGRPAGCKRSDRNYPALVAAGLGLRAAEFRDVSCSGAVVADLSAPQSTDHGVNPAQLSALSTATRLVTLGIGGNDIGFGSLITTCVRSGVKYQLEKRIGDGTADRAPCRSRYVSGGTDEVEGRIRTAGGRLAGVLRDIERRAPEARIYVVGYPAILPAEGTDCTAMGLAPGDVGFLREKERQLNAVLRDTARAAGAGYVDTYAPSTGRDACADPGVRWVEPLVPAAPAAPAHPNERGERGMAEAVLREVGAAD